MVLTCHHETLLLGTAHFYTDLLSGFHFFSQFQNDGTCQRRKAVYVHKFLGCGTHLDDDRLKDCE
jgi:hypothetical protein